MSAQAEIVDIRWTIDARCEHQATVAPAKFVELCGKLPAALTVHWGFEAGAPLDFDINIHYHVGKEVFPIMYTGARSRARVRLEGGARRGATQPP